MMQVKSGHSMLFQGVVYRGKIPDLIFSQMQKAGVNTEKHCEEIQEEEEIKEDGESKRAARSKSKSKP